MTKDDFDLWLKISTIKYEELEAKRLKMLEEQVKALRIENRNLKGYRSEYWLPLVPSNHIPMPSCCFSCLDKPTEETDNET